MIYEGLIDTLVDFDGDAFRNIPSIIQSEDLLDDLSEDVIERRYGEAAVESEKEYEGPQSPIILRPFMYGTAIGDSPYARPATRFSDGTHFGVWYGSLELETTVHESVYHFVNRMRDMLKTFETEIVSERRIFLVHVAGILVDLRGKHAQFPGLMDQEDYIFTNSVGAYLFSRGQSGLLIKSARCEGTNVAAFDPKILSNVRHNCYMVYRLSARSGTVMIENPPDRRWLEIKIAF